MIDNLGGFQMKLRDIVIFLAGAQFFHTISHIILPYFLSLPLDMKVITLTPSLNSWVIVVNALITILLIFWAYRLKQ